MKPQMFILEIRDRVRPSGDIIAWLLVEIEEMHRYEADKTIREASISISYKKVAPKALQQKDDKGNFSGRYYACENEVSLTSGAIFLDLRGLEGQRIGTYLMNKIVLWAKRWPEASVRSIKLFGGQACDENRVRRNWFYEQFGLTFEYTDPEHRTGGSNILLVEELTSVDRWKENISEHQIDDYLSYIFNAKHDVERERDDLRELLVGLRAKQEKAEQQPLRWAFRRLYFYYKGDIVVLSLLSIGFILIWLKI